MKTKIFICSITCLFFSCQSNFYNDDIIGEWYYENGFDNTTQDSIYYEKTIVRFLKNGEYEYLKNNKWTFDPKTKWKFVNDVFMMGDGRSGTIINGETIVSHNARWQAKMIQKDTIKGWFETYTPPLKTHFILIRKKD